MGIKLINTETGLEVNIGDTVTTFRDEKYILNAVYPTNGKTGKVQLGEDNCSQLFYPTVIGCTFVEEDGQ